MDRIETNEKYDLLIKAFDDSAFSNELKGVIVTELQEITTYIWEKVANKWPNLFFGDKSRRSIIQGAIGYSAINKYIGYRIKGSSAKITRKDFLAKLDDWIQEISIGEVDWVPGGRFSKYSSESGYIIVAKELERSACC